MTRHLARLGAMIVVAALIGIGSQTPDRVAAAEPTPPPPAELQYIPGDAAIFFHANPAELWSHAVVQSIRGSDKPTFDQLSAKLKKHFGSELDDLKSIAIFWPKIKGPRDTQSFGVVLKFNKPFDKALLKKGMSDLEETRQTKSELLTPSDTLAVFLANLDAATYGKPQKLAKDAPLAAALREAASGKHLAVLAANLVNLPDEIRGDNLPLYVQPFKPLLDAETIVGTIDLGKELKAELRVKAATPPRAGEAEKSLGLLADLAHDFIGLGIKELARETKPDLGLKDAAALLGQLQKSLKAVKFSTEGTTARAALALPLDQPLANIYLSVKRKAQEAATQAQTSNNLKQIALAMHLYHDTMGSLPPAAVCDKKGKPMLSWRVLILPYLEQSALYKEFKLDEPWDSAHNKKLIARMPKTYAVPFPTSAKANETHFRMFVGNDAILDYLKGGKITEITDGTSNTLMVVTAKDAVPWTKPDELEFDPEKDMTKLLNFLANDRCPVAFCDGSVQKLKKSISRKSLNALITRNGGEIVNLDE